MKPAASMQCDGKIQNLYQGCSVSSCIQQSLWLLYAFSLLPCFLSNNSAVYHPPPSHASPIFLKVQVTSQYSIVTSEMLQSSCGLEPGFCCLSESLVKSCKPIELLFPLHII